MSNIFWRHRHLLHVGDKVCIRIDPFFPKPETGYPIGTIGEIVGFTIKSVCRTNTYDSLPPGIYLCPDWPFVRFDAGIVCNIPANSLELLDKIEYEKRLKQSCEEWPHNSSPHSTFVSDLPDTKIWEGDIVRPKYIQPKRVKPGSIPDLPDAYMVTWISFGRPGEITESLGDVPNFSIGDRFMQKSENNWSGSHLELVERGNFWRRAHGESPIFRDLEEESFWAWLVNEVECLPAPQKQLKPWEKDYLSDLSPEVQLREKAKWYNEEAALSCIRDGSGHGIMTHHTFADIYDSTPYEWYNVIRFKNEDLGQRVVEATLNGFRVPSPDYIDDKKS